MRYLSIFLLIITSFAYGQEKNEVTLSKTDEFSNRSGVLIQKEFQDLATIGGVKFQLFKVKDLTSDEEIKSIRIETKSRKSYGTETHINTIDADELKGFLFTIDKIVNEVTNTAPENYTEIVFESRGGLRLGAFSGKKWINFIRVEKFDSDSMELLKIDELKEIHKLLTEVQAQL